MTEESLTHQFKRGLNVESGTDELVPPLASYNFPNQELISALLNRL